jgi:uncharacterized protein (DUF924 family)
VIAPIAQTVLDFWFGAAGSPECDTVRSLWFTKSDATDRDIAQRFGPPIDAALLGAYSGEPGNASSDWTQQPASALAQIVLLDQFTRNVFRGTPRAFAGDARALAAARVMLQARHDDALAPVRRAFVYLPFEHAEDIGAQDEAVRRFTRLAQVAPETQAMLDYAHKHRAVIARFGRFPHRNAILSRPSTVQELAFLQEPGAGF